MTYEDYLIHSSELQHAFWTKKKPKYFKKDKGRYFYSKEEWDAYLRKGQKKFNKAVNSFKKDVTKKYSQFQKDRKVRDRQRAIERAERSRRFKQGLVDMDRAVKNFANNLPKSMSEIKASASKQIEKGKMFAAVALGNARGQMRRFGDKVVKPAAAKAKAAADRINTVSSKLISELKKTGFGIALAKGKAFINLAFEAKIAQPVRRKINRRDEENARKLYVESLRADPELSKNTRAFTKAHYEYNSNKRREGLKRQWDLDEQFEAEFERIKKQLGL